MAQQFTLMPLPYDVSALQPTISARAVELHHGKHHRGYVDKLNELVKNTPYARMSLESIIKTAAADDSAKKIFNNAAQVWNHEYFWHSMTPGGAGPDKRIKSQLESDFGTLDQFSKTFVKAAVEHFGSGWVWLSAASNGGLKVVSTHDAKSPLLDGHRALLCCDLWEHAYYLDYQNDREGFVHDFLSRLANWDYAGEQYATPAAAE
jgi:superoxide dismutase, Fe-Mn family